MIKNIQFLEPDSWVYILAGLCDHAVGKLSEPVFHLKHIGSNGIVFIVVLENKLKQEEVSPVLGTE